MQTSRSSIFDRGGLLVQNASAFSLVILKIAFKRFRLQSASLLSRSVDDAACDTDVLLARYGGGEIA